MVFKKKSNKNNNHWERNVSKSHAVNNPTSNFHSWCDGKLGLKSKTCQHLTPPRTSTKKRWHKKHGNQLWSPVKLSPVHGEILHFPPSHLRASISQTLTIIFIFHSCAHLCVCAASSHARKVGLPLMLFYVYFPFRP